MKVQPILVTFLCLAMAGTLSAQYGGPLDGPMGPGGGGANARRNPAGGGQQNQLKALQTELAQEQGELKRIEEELQEDFEEDPEWQEAEAALKQAEQEHEAARQVVLNKVYDTPEYKAALDKKFTAETELANLNASGETAPEQIQAVSSTMMDAAGEIRRMEDDALASDAAVSETKAKLTEATANMNALRKKFRESLELNESYLTQSDRVEDAKFKLADARQRMQEQTRRQGDQTRKQNTTNRPKRNTGGGRPGY